MQGKNGTTIIMNPLSNILVSDLPFKVEMTISMGIIDFNVDEYTPFRLSIEGENGGIVLDHFPPVEIPEQVLRNAFQKRLDISLALDLKDVIFSECGNYMFRIKMDKKEIAAFPFKVSKEAVER